MRKWNVIKAVCFISFLILVAFNFNSPIVAYTGHRPLWKYEMGAHVSAVDISTNGTYLVAGQDPGHAEGSIAFFSKDSSGPLWGNITEDEITSLALSADGRYLAVGSFGRVYLCDTYDSSFLRLFRGYSGQFSVDISADGTYLAATNGSEVLLYQRSVGFIANYSLDSQAMNVVISEDGRYLAAGSFQGYIYFFDRLLQVPVWNFKADGQVFKIDMTADGRYFVAGSKYHNNIYCFNRTGLLWNYTTPNVVYAVSISPNGDYIAGGSGVLYFFNRSISHPLWNYTLAASDLFTWDIAFSMEGHYMAVGTEYHLYFFYSNNSAPVWSFQAPSSTGEFYRVAMSADGQYIVAGVYTGQVYLFHRTDQGPDEIPGYEIGWGLLALILIFLPFIRRRRTNHWER
jgi:WD40 repeat protein